MDDKFWGRGLELCEWKGKTRKELSAKVGISYSSIHNGIKLNSIPSADIALNVAHELNTSVEYLVKGVCVSEATRGCELSSENRTLMEQYNRLTEFNKQTIQELTQSLLRRQ